MIHPQTLLIRDERPDDAAAIAQVTRTAFATAEHSSGTEEFIIAALRSAGQLSLSLVAQMDGGIVGHVAISPVEISDGARDWYGLGPVSVLPDCQGTGVGSRSDSRMPFSCAFSPRSCSAPCTTWCGAQAIFSTCSWPASTFDRSRMSLIRPSRCLPLWWIVSR